ncbi:MAG: selenocysteine-specific translation elongation factor [Planctomycetes bacterium]|nr:selenocysteine-specific translation elongation factor [Planctomycetota bacterium]
MASSHINMTLGTAGHVDHGKTALVRLLTGCETDRLREEKERGMSIELGFAPCLVAGQEVGIVDVPGHEHFIKTMVAGATGMDAVLLVVAADDGIMPQTREHLDILTLLGIRHGIVALTKVDRVDRERVERVQDDLRGFLQSTFLEGAPVFPLSNVTGEGLDAFLGGLKALVAAVRPKTPDGVFRLPVERTFSVKGYGTVLTGIPVAGTAAIGDEVVLLPQGTAGRITGLQAYGHDTELASAGQCTAVNVRHWNAKAIERGNVLTLPGFFAPAEWFVCRLRLLPHETYALKNAAKVKFHTGTSERQATVYLMAGDIVRAGEVSVIQVRLDAPVVAGPGDPFILRTMSPPATVGGGAILEEASRRFRRNTPGLCEGMEALAAVIHDPKAHAEYALRTAASVAVSEPDLSRRVKATLPRLQETLRELADQGLVIRLPGGLAVHRDVAEAAQNRLAAILEEFHRQSPESPGMEPEALLAASGLDKAVCDALLGRLREAGRIVERSARLALAQHRPALADGDREEMQQVESLLRDRPFNPPTAVEIGAAAGLADERVARALRLLTEQERLVQVAPGLVFHVEAVAQAERILVDYIRREGQLESVKFKYLLDTTRKFAIPLLDYFDRIGVTRAAGHTRYLRAARRQG